MLLKKIYIWDKISIDYKERGIKMNKKNKLLRIIIATVMIGAMVLGTAGTLLYYIFVR